MAYLLLRIYNDLRPRLHAAWTSFWYPALELVAPSVGLIRTSAHGRTYGVYVGLDVPTWESGSGASVLLRRVVDGRIDELTPPPLPGVRILLTPRDLGAVEATVFDPLDESVIDIPEESFILA